MKTRKSMLGKDVLEKDVQGSVVSCSTDSPSIVRKLRSRIITSDTEDDCHVRTKTPKSNRKIVKENSKSLLDNDEVGMTSTKPKCDVGLETRTPKQNKRLSAVNLFRIEEVKEEVEMEEFKSKVKEEDVENESDEDTLNDDEDSCSVASKNDTSDEESSEPTNVIVKAEVSMPEGTEEDTSNGESVAEVIKEENAERVEVETQKIFMGDKLSEDIDFDSDDELPEAVSFSSSKNTISTELSLIAEAVRKEKEKKKDLARKKIEMIRIQKAEKEEKRRQKMKFLEINIPERLAEDVTNSLPDRPDIPTVKKSVSTSKKRKSDKKEEPEHKIDERKNKILKFDDYIPISDVPGSTQFGVVPLEVTARLPKPSSQSAAEFKRNALFGSRIQREPSKNLLIYRQKLSAAGKLQKGFKSSSLLKV